MPTDSAVTVIKSADDTWEPRTLAILGQYPPDRFNVLVPTVSLRQVNPYLVPDIEAVQLDPNPDSGEIYHDPQMKAGHFGPTKVGLRLLAQVAGITTISSRRTDDGHDPDYLEWQVEIEMVQSSGRPIRAFGSKQIDLRPHMTNTWTPERLHRAREHMVGNGESKAMNRAIRSILSLRASYLQRDLAKPFAILRYVPDMTHPEVRARFLDMVAPATAALYGPDRSESNGTPKLVGPGEAIDKAPEAPDDADDEAADAFAAASTATIPAPDMPDWAKPLTELLGDTAAASDLVGPADEAQKARLQHLIGGLDWVTEIIPVLVRSFGEPAARSLTAGQAAAIATIADSYQSAETFVAAWKAAAEA